MFNLVSKRYLFLLISLAVIVPGAISMILKGFDVGIDFAGGSSLEFRPSTSVNLTSTQQVTNLLDQLNLKDVQVTIGNDASTPGNHVAWVRLNTEIDTNAENTIKTDLTNAISGASVTFDPLQITGKNGKTTTVTVVTISSKTTAIKESTITTALKTLPKTTKVSQSSSSSSPSPVSPATTPTPTATPQATATPTATATTTASSTPTVTPTSTPSSSSSSGTIQVKIDSIKIGQTTGTINVLTTTSTSIAIERQIKSLFLNRTGNYLYTMSDTTVGAAVASATIRNSFFAVLAASALILLYIWFAFRKVQKPWRYGTCAIIALLHDVLVVMGVFSILGWTLHIQIDSLFVTALLTVVGFSVHDTIVVFDRIRENMQRRSSETFEQIVNASLIQTMSRSLNTSLTVLLTLSALTLFGGESTRVFTFTLLIGIFSGTYSSIFNASMLLVIWERGELGLWRFNREARSTKGRGRQQAREREMAKARG